MDLLGSYFRPKLAAITPISVLALALHEVRLGRFVASKPTSTEKNVCRRAGRPWRGRGESPLMR